MQVEATKFTEVGFHGRDVDQIIRDLVDNAIVMTRQKQRRKLRREVELAVEKKILDALCGDSAKGDSRVSCLAGSLACSLQASSLSPLALFPSFPCPSVHVCQRFPSASMQVCTHHSRGNFASMGCVRLQDAFQKLLRKGDLDKRTIRIDASGPRNQMPSLEGFTGFHEVMIKVRCTVVVKRGSG